LAKRGRGRGEAGPASPEARAARLPRPPRQARAGITGECRPPRDRADGPFAVDAKNYSGKLTLSKGTLWHGRHPLTKTLAVTRWEAERVSQTLSIRLGGQSPDVTPVMCVLGAELPKYRFEIDGVRVISGGRHLVRDIENRGTVLSSEAVNRLMELAARSLPPAAP
jgi:hypothetical protein